jgi:arginine-tRNA-protein transferase
MHRRRGWPRQTITEEEYYYNFLAGGWPFAREFLYYDQNRLVGVALTDVTGHSISSVYFYHDPAWRPEGPGVFSIMQQLQYAKERGLEHHYLGYWIAECPSMAYKSRYRPHEVLVGYPRDDEEPKWRLEW